MMEFANKWGNAASIGGLLLSMIGFALTIYSVHRSKSAAIAAKEAAIDAKEAALTFDSIAALSRIIETLENTKEMNRSGNWGLAVGRFAESRRALISVRQSTQRANSNQRIMMQAGIAALAEIEREIERNLHGDKKINTPKINKLISDTCDDLQTLLTEFRAGGL